MLPQVNGTGGPISWAQTCLPVVVKTRSQWTPWAGPCSARKSRSFRA
jgi:hypothetical protein